MVEFPHLTDDTPFPDVSSVDVFQYQNEIDYKRFDQNQMTITLTNVPYDLGEVHVGQRTVSGVGNVVYFETIENRDKWLADQPKLQLQTKYRRFHDKDEIKIPLPFDVATRYNYVYIDYPMVSSDNDPLEFQDQPRISRWLYFIREVRRESTNSTILVVKRDAWQTFIYYIKIKALMLSRGHAPLKACLADQFLSNPLKNNRFIVGEELVINDAQRITNTQSVVLNNGNMFSCFVTTANVNGAWDDKTPALSSYIVDGDPVPFVFGIPSTSFEQFMKNVDNLNPQFKQTVQAMFIISSEFIKIDSTFTFCNIQCSKLSSNKVSKNLLKLNKALFNYSDEYKNLAKLYTFPYAYIQVVDEQGAIDIIKIEECANTLSIEAISSLAYPYIAIDCHINGVKSNQNNIITFKNLSTHTIDLMGSWFDYFQAKKLPLFEVIQDNSVAYDFSTRFDRAQQSNAAEIAYQNAVASANTELSNANASASTITSNAALTTAGNTSITELNNSAQSTDVYLSNEMNQANQAWNAGYTRATTNNQINYEVQSAAISAVGNVANAICSPNPVAGLISGIASAATAGLQTAASTNLATEQAEAGIANSQNLVTAGNTNNSDKYNNQAANNTSVTNVGNSVTSGQAANNAATTRNNASRSNSTAIANADRTRTLQNNAITNGIKQAALDAPKTFGIASNIDYSTTRPLMYQANIITLNDGAIASAGDIMLKYGYNWSGYWPFTTFNLMERFTYWQADEIITESITIPDLYVDEIRYFLLGGVTVWSAPEYIGHTTIYENGV